MSLFSKKIVGFVIFQKYASISQRKSKVEFEISAIYLPPLRF
jgi:hypothetical protein